jgi:hypothetical protein
MPDEERDLSFAEFDDPRRPLYLRSERRHS